jgi:hypothetical protein
MTWPRGDPDAVARNVLAGADFRGAVATPAAKPHATLLGVVWDWIREHLLPLLHPLGQALAASRDAGTAVGIALVILALGGLAFVAFRLALAFVRVPGERGKSAPHVRELAEPRDSRDWRALAAAAAGRGEFARAIAALFAAALALLDECDVIARDAARTPGEYRRMLRRAWPASAAPFDELAECFVNALYAPQPPGLAAYEAAARALAAFERTLRAGAAAFAA